MNKRQLLLAGAVAIPLTLGAGLMTCGKLGDGQRQEAARVQHQNDVAAMVKRLKACPDRNDPVCLSPAQKIKLGAAAETSKALGDNENAGLDYARLGMDNEAKTMADACEQSGNIRGRDRIMEALKVRADALGRSAEEDDIADPKTCVPAGQVENLKRRADEAEKAVQSATGQIEALKTDLAACNAARQETKPETEQPDKEDAGN